MTRLHVEDLTFGYRAAGRPVVDGLTATFPDAATTVVTGPSGSGKSTLLYLLGLLLQPDRGVVLVDGVPASGLPDPERSAIRSRRVGFVFQDALLDPSRSALDNVLEPAVFAGVPRAAARARAVQLLHRMGVGHRVAHRPGQMSGGQAQRVALCRALLLSPGLVLGDEPTGNLDTANADVVWSALSDAAAEGATVVVATHDPRLVERADHRVELR
ncbi:ABC transporter ATP-binding protein [Cellulomonas sp. Marseille-Q8402]